MSATGGAAAGMPTARARGLVACTRCARVWPRGRSECGRCGSALVSRDRQSLQRVWAWLAVGIIAYVPANTYPMLRTKVLFDEDESTIIGGAIEVMHHGAVGIALVILAASVVIPIGKFLAVGYLAYTIHRPAAMRPEARHRLYHVVEFIGRWSMIDVFVVAILSSLVQLKTVANIAPGPAALTFALSVVFTMLAAQSFDPRMLWDADDRVEPERTAV